MLFLSKPDRKEKHTKRSLKYVKKKKTNTHISRKKKREEKKVNEKKGLKIWKRRSKMKGQSLKISIRSLALRKILLL